jgi:hypothetical protein
MLQAKSVVKNQGKSLEGFGIVTLASAFPVLAVELLSIVLSVSYTREDIRTNFGTHNCSEGAVNAKPAAAAAAATDAALVTDAILFALRSILPLNAFLILLIVFVLRVPLPSVSFAVPIPSDLLPDSAASASSFSKRPSPGGDAHQHDDEGTDDEGEAGEDDKARRKRLRQERKAKMARAVDLAAQTASPAGRPDRRQASIDAQRPELPAAAGALSVWGRVGRHGPLLLGIAESQAGMMLFNIGLTYGFTALGNESGELLPASFLATGTPDSPLYAYGPGVAIVMVTVFVLGFLATRAEPALRVMGRTVESLSEGRFTTSMLIYTVCAGVACGMVVGSAKILFSVNLMVIILAAYAIASLLTVYSSEEFTNIGWDSAGVTTGPVTVPFVLSLGIGFAKASGAQEVPPPLLHEKLLLPGGAPPPLLV